MIPETPHPVDPFSKLIPAIPLSGVLSAIFCHPWHFIIKEAEEWRTETAYPIKSAVLWHLWQDAKTFIGVRFGQLTRYGLIDIDIHSPYHPNRDPAAIPGIIRALESIGIYRVLIVRSSDSGGLHLYIPLDTPINTYGLATALRLCCEDAGFVLAPGRLEIFPNCKAFKAEGYTNYNGHRLPLQAGSYLLNDDYQPITNDLGFFFKVWDLSASGNNHRELESTIALNKERPIAYARGGLSKGEKWREDCERAISEGWTNYGQTNDLLKVFAQYGRVFLALSGEELVAWLLATVIDAPGYERWCRHRHHIARRCREWAKEVESYYYPYPAFLPRSKNPWGQSEANTAKSSSAVDRIRDAYELVKNFGYQTMTDLANSIAAIAKCSFTTLYKNLPLWQPKPIEESKGCVINSNPCPELDRGDHPETPSEDPKPLPAALLHTRSHKKVLNPVTDFAFPETSKKTHSQPSPTLPGFDFGDRAALNSDLPQPENPYQGEECGNSAKYYLNRAKLSLLLFSRDPRYCIPIADL